MTYDIFSPKELCGFRFRNRIIRSATHEGMADSNGRPQQALVGLYKGLAAGGAGAIITGITGIDQSGKIAKNMMMIDRDDLVEDYRILCDTAHANGAPIIMQIGHAGRQTYSSVTGLTPVAPSAIRDKVFSDEIPQELTEDQIEGIIESFVNAIIRAKSAGFDAVQIHAAHGYLLSQFLSPYMNRRNDRWGGRTENRFRILKEIFANARKKAGDYPIMVKLNAYDDCENGMKIDEAISISRLLKQSGCCAIEVSCGVAEDGLFSIRAPKVPVEAIINLTSGIKRLSPQKKALFAQILPKKIKIHQPLFNYNIQAAMQIKRNVDIAVIVVGGIRTLSDIEMIIGEKMADFVSLSRPFIIEPDIVDQFRSGKKLKSGCINCGFCLYGCLENPLKCYYGKAPEEV